MDAPDAPDAPATEAAKEDPEKSPESIPMFDIQDIPNTIRVLGMPKAAKLLDKWFAGELNYSPDEKSSVLGLNQDGLPFPQSMVDRTSISLEWVLQFNRAKAQFDIIQTHEWLTRVGAMKKLRDILLKYAGHYEIISDAECGGDIQKIHKLFQFQLANVEGSFAEKINQFMIREVLYRGIPDELSLMLGSFSFYAAISRARFGWDSDRVFAVVTHIYVYVKDGFTFSDKEDQASQYLGHWSKKSVAIAAFQVGATEVLKRAWIDHPILEKPLRGKFDVMYPVKNSDFRRWQLRHGQGGDFIIFTNKVNVMLGIPIKVYLS